MKVVNISAAKSHPLNGLVTYLHTGAQLHYSAGVKKLADEEDAEWLIDLVLVLQKNPLLAQHRTQLWQFLRLEEDCFMMKAFDRHGVQVHIGLLPLVTLPFDYFFLHVVDGVLLLPSEL